MKLCFPQPDKMYEHLRQPAMAIDLGFARRDKKSCGLAWQEAPEEECKIKGMNFGQCVKRTAEFVSKNSSPVLIIEAPLSGLFDCEGNPKGRQSFEKSEDSPSTRYWYVGAGAAMGLGAVFFFTRLSRRVSQNHSVVSVVEGFVSFKTDTADDKEDAHALLKAFRNPNSDAMYQVKANANEQTVNLLSFAGLCLPEDPCAAVIVAEKQKVSKC